MFHLNHSPIDFVFSEVQVFEYKKRPEPFYGSRPGSAVDVLVRRHSGKGPAANKDEYDYYKDEFYCYPIFAHGYASFRLRR